MKDARQLVLLLSDPARSAEVEDWTSLLSVARAESLIGSLAYRLQGQNLPAKVDTILEGARRDADHARVQALWEAEMARRALGLLDVNVILLKGTAYVAADSAAGIGRSIGDLDIMVPHARLDAVQDALLGAGWEWVKQDDYDDRYYRQWMHELPPLIHKERDRMIDVHHTILPLTARPTPDATAMFAESEILPNGLRILCPADRIIHAVAHLFADGDLAGGLRNLWDIDRMLREFAVDPGFWKKLRQRAWRHQLTGETARALRLAAHLYDTPVEGQGRAKWADRFYERRLLARGGWGRETERPLRLAFYIRSHWLRMPPLMLAGHLLKKALR